MVLSGTFGELRNNHFHSGLDIKTQGKSGIEVYAAAAGYVSRIKVSQFGFGKAIYITHPNGYMTVYAHLSKFENAIENYVKSIQYKKESYETGNIYLGKNTFTLKKGELIGYSGNTGSSAGPHLHFEIRNKKKRVNVINPMQLGLTVSDTIKPSIKTLMVYSLEGNSRINQLNNNYTIPIKETKNGTFVSERISASGKIGFGIEAFDRLNNARNKNGVHSIKMLVNGKEHFYFDVEKFSFEESKYINLFIDYHHYKTYKKRIQRLFKVPQNKLSLYKNLTNNGALFIKDGYNYTVEIIVTDFNRNESTIKIPIKGMNSNTIFSKEKDTTNYKIIATQFNTFSKEYVTIAFPKKTFYEDTYIDFSVEDGIAYVHNPTIPLNRSYTLTFDVSDYSTKEKEQLYIANIDNSKYPSYMATRKKDSTFYTTTKQLGKYTLLVDSIKPSIKPLYFKDNQWISSAKTLQVKIKDKESGIKDYRASIDEQWILMEYDHKKDILTYNFNDKKLLGSKHQFNIVVSDNVGNTNQFSATFYKKQDH